MTGGNKETSLKRETISYSEWSDSIPKWPKSIRLDNELYLFWMGAKEKKKKKQKKNVKRQCGVVCQVFLFQSLWKREWVNDQFDQVDNI